MTDVIEVTATDEIEIIEVATQGPPGIQGESGFTVGIDVISGGASNTDYSAGYVFDGGTA